MSMIPNPCLEIHTRPQPKPREPEWFAEVVMLVEVLRREGLLHRLSQQVRLSRGRMGIYEPIDFVAVLIGYAISGERTLERFYERLAPFSEAFMALFGRKRLPHRSSLSRFLKAVDEACVHSLKTVMLPLGFQLGWSAQTLGGLLDRLGLRHLVFDVDGTRALARQRALPTDASLPEPHRRMEAACAPGYGGRKRGEVVRTRTTILQMHSQQWVDSFGGRGNGQAQEELKAALGAIEGYLAGFDLPLSMALLRLDGLYGEGAFVVPLIEAAIPFVTRWNHTDLLWHPQIQEALLQEPVARLRSQSGVELDLFDGGWVPVARNGPCARFIVQRHRRPEGQQALHVGHLQEGWVYELFACLLPTPAFLAQDVVDLYHGRGAFEGVLAQEDQEGDPDRWCSHAPNGQALWQAIWHTIWNLRLSLGLQLSGEGLRHMEWATEEPSPPQLVPIPESRSYGPWELPTQTRANRGQLPASAFVLLENGEAKCPAGARLLPLAGLRQETAEKQRRIYAAQASSCGSCAWRDQCLGAGAPAQQVRHISAVRRLLPGACTRLAGEGMLPAMRWEDVAARAARRRWRTHWQAQELTIEPCPDAPPAPPPSLRTDREERRHQRLSWRQRLARNAHLGPPRWSLTVAGVPSFLSA